MKIAIAVPGRFHAFDLALELLTKDHEVIVLTNYPKWAAARFGLPRHTVRSFWIHGILFRFHLFLHDKYRIPLARTIWQTMFGKWVARQLAKDTWDVVHIWTGVAEESLHAIRAQGCLRTIMRGSAHIRVQAQILEEEAVRCRTAIQMPTTWQVEREEREYNACDIITVLSSFALTSFVSQGIPRSKIWLIPPPIPTKQFVAAPQTIEQRCHRVLSGAPLRTLFVGTLSYQKGLLDLATIVTTLDQSVSQCRLVGHVAPEAVPLLESLRNCAELIPQQPQSKLREIYDWADIFIFPTIQDGYALVLAEAHTNGLPILATTSSGAPDIVKDGVNGWLFKPKDPNAFVDRILWCHRNRSTFATMVRQIASSTESYDHTSSADRFLDLALAEIAAKRTASG